MRQHQQQGFVLLSVVVTLFIVAAIALLINRESSMGVNLVASEMQTKQVRYVAEAGLKHASWQVNKNNCTGYPNPLTANFAAHSYNVSISPSSGSPVLMTATATLASGEKYTLIRNNLVINQLPITAALQPDAAAGKDTYIYQWKGSWNFGVNPTLKVLNEPPDSNQHALVQFDVSAIPAEAIILSAKLELHSSSNAWDSTPVNIHRVTSSWVEGNASGGNGAGANWTETDTGVAWSASGGDFDPTISATAVSPGAVGWMSWDISFLVSGWVSTSTPNYGLLLRTPNTYQGAVFNSSDATDADLRPKLTVTYSCECGQVCTGGGGSSKPLLFVTASPAPTAQEQLRIDLIESWGYAVNLIVDNDIQAKFDAALAVNEVVYIPATVDPVALGTKLLDATLGVVNESMPLAETFGFDQGYSTKSRDQIRVLDNSHDITSPLATGYIPIMTSLQTLYLSNLGTTQDSDAHLLADVYNIGTDANNKASLMTLSPGDALETGGGTAAGSRVQLPWGDSSFDVAVLNGDGLKIMRRAIEWVGAPSTGGSCSADYSATAISSEFSTLGYTQRLNRAVTYFPEEQVLNGVTSPAGGAWVAMGGSGIVWLLGMDGTVLDENYKTGLSQLEGIAFVPAANLSDPGHLAIVTGTNLYYSDMTLPANASFSTHSLSTFVNSAGGITYIDGGTYDGNLAVADKGSGEVHIIDSSFNLVVTLASGSLLSTPEGIAHLKDTDKFLVIDTSFSWALIIDIDLSLSQKYDLTPFGLGAPTGAAAAIHPTSCEHFFGDRPNNRYVYLNAGGG